MRPKVLKFWTPLFPMQEILKMLHYDALTYPSENQLPPDTKEKKKSHRKNVPGPESHINYLSLVPYDDLEPEDYKSAADLIEMEVERLKQNTDHGNFDYDHIVDEVSQQLVFMPSSAKWTRNSLSSRKDRLDSCEVRLSTNKSIIGRVFWRFFFGNSGFFEKKLS